MKRRSHFVLFVKAEFLRIYATRVPQICYLAITAACYLWVFQMYYVEKVSIRMTPSNFFYAFPVLFFGTWKSLAFPVTIICCAASWMVIESQHGMIRVCCTQPVARWEYLAGKMLAILGHVALMTLVYIGAQLGYVALYSGVRGFNAAQAAALGRFVLHQMVLVLALTWIAVSVASFRKTSGAAIVTACLAMIFLGFMTTLPHDVLPPEYVFMRLSVFPIGDLPNPFGHWRDFKADNPFRQIYTPLNFYLVMFITPLLFFLPALLHFTRRDITE